MKKTEEWRETFRKFYNDNEQGGSSRWLVAPNVVEVFIEASISHALAEREAGWKKTAKAAYDEGFTDGKKQRDREIRKRGKRLEHNLTEADLAHSTPLIRGGKTVIKGTRITIQEIVEFLLSHKEES